MPKKTLRIRHHERSFAVKPSQDQFNSRNDRNVSTGSSSRRSGTLRNTSRELEQYPYKELTIAVITKRDERGEQLIRELQRTRANVEHIWPIPERIPNDFDVVYCDLVPNLPSRLDVLPGTST